MEGIPMLILSVGSIVLMLFFVTYSSQRHNLNSIKDKTVGNGQHGTARWATQQEIKRTYHHVPFTPELWRQAAREGRTPTANGKPLPQGIILGSKGMKTTTALVDSDDVHVLMIGASGVGKTAYFLYPNLEYACASGMSFLALDTKGDLARNYGAIARDIYGYRISVVDGLPAMLPQSQMNAALTTASKYQDLIQTTRRLQEAKDELDERWDEVGDQISELWSDSSCFLIKPREWIAEQYGEKIADIWAGIEIEDPYALCFAFLYLVDQGSDYPWVYYPGVTLFSMTMDTLPWCRTAYKGDPEGVWDHFDPDTLEVIPGPEKAELPKRIKVPELENWNRMQYLDQYEDELGYQEKVSLAQVMYELTGCIMPRNLQRYYPALPDLDAYGITGKKALHPLIYCMNLLGEGKYRSRKMPRMEWDMEEQPEGTQKTGQTESVEELKARIAALQSENNRLRQTVYEVDRELREARKASEIQAQKAELDRQELVDLRELVFHLQEDVYDAEAESTGITFPYHNFQRIVVFGGHDSWTREIKPRLPDVRFVDKDMVPNAELIRRAEIVWIQANAISHAYYYKILDETRKHSIPVRYFSYASALKCAEQLAEQDMKEAQK